MLQLFVKDTESCTD